MTHPTTEEPRRPPEGSAQDRKAKRPETPPHGLEDAAEAVERGEFVDQQTAESTGTLPK